MEFFVILYNGQVLFDGAGACGEKICINFMLEPNIRFMRCGTFGTILPAAMSWLLIQSENKR
uniref:Uncharacterized protein n=1 Tax=Romanomermis culicivorax TaxID=13658 RepID=A0A915KZW7_ROMCU